MKKNGYHGLKKVNQNHKKLSLIIMIE